MPHIDAKERSAVRRGATCGVQNGAVAAEYDNAFRHATNIIGGNIFKLLTAFVHTEDLVLIDGRDQYTCAKLDQLIRHRKCGVCLIVYVKIGDQSEALHKITFLPKQFYLPACPPQDPLPQEKKAPDIQANNFDNLIDWKQSAVCIERFVRALNPFIIAVSNFRDNNVRIFSTSVEDIESEYPAGTICNTDGKLSIATGGGILNIEIIQYGTYLVTTGKDFVNRFNVKLGESFY